MISEYKELQGICMYHSAIDSKQFIITYLQVMLRGSPIEDGG